MDNFDNMYKKGIETRSKVINAAKKLFYQYGYNKTTINMIKNEASVSLSTIPYYFNKKDDILIVIYNEFLSSIHEFIEKEIHEKMDSYLKHFCASKVYYYIIFNNKNNKNFYYEVSVSQSNYELLYPIVNRLIFDYASEFNIPLTDNELKLIQMADAGARREILYNYYHSIKELSVDELVNFVTSIPGNLMGIDKSISKKYGELSSEYVRNLNYSHIRFLV